MPRRERFLATPPSEPPVRVVLADDHDTYRYALGALLAADGRLEVVGDAADGRGALDLVHRFRPRVALVDVMMRPVDGFEVCAGLLTSATEVILLSAHEDPELVARARAAGAAAYVSKDSSNEALCGVVLAVAAGRTSFDAVQPIERRGAPRPQKG
jgi:two-component system nitrate/nitrite response regulator NarL